MKPASTRHLIVRLVGTTILHSASVPAAAQWTLVGLHPEGESLGANAGNNGLGKETLLVATARPGPNGGWRTMNRLTFAHPTALASHCLALLRPAILDLGRSRVKALVATSALLASLGIIPHAAQAQMHVREYHHRAEASVYGEPPERPGYTNEVKGSGHRVWTAEGAASAAFSRSTTAKGSVFGTVQSEALRIHGSLDADGARSGEAVWTTGMAAAMARFTFEISQPHGFMLTASVSGSGYTSPDGLGVFSLYMIAGGNSEVLSLSSDPEAGVASSGTQSGILAPGTYYLGTYAGGKGIQYGSRSTFGSGTVVFDLQLNPTNVVPGTTPTTPLRGRTTQALVSRDRPACQDDRCLTNAFYCFNCTGESFVVPGTNAWIQASASLGVDLLMTGTNRFTALAFPDNSDTNRVFSVTADGIPIGNLGYGQSLNLSGDGARVLQILGVQTPPVFEEVAFVLNVSYSGQARFEAIPFPAIIPPLLETAGELHVDLRPSQAGHGTWTNLGSLGDFTGIAARIPNVAGTTIPGMEFFAADNYFSGPNSVPDLDGDSDRSVEVWAYTSRMVGEPTLVSWGLREAPGRNLSLNYGTNATSGAAYHGGNGVGWNSFPKAASWHHLTYTYSNREVSIYVDGLLDNRLRLTEPLSTAGSNRINLGFQREAIGRKVQFFDGYINAVRVHGGALTADQVRKNYLFGPWHTNMQPQIIVSAEPTEVGAGERVDISARVLSSEDPVEFVNLRTKELFLGRVVPPFLLAVTNFPPGTHTIFGEVIDRAGNVYPSPPVKIVVRSPKPVPFLHATRSADRLRILWPDIDGAVLFKTGDLLDPKSWVPVQGTSKVEAGQRWIEVDTQGGPSFFQLRRLP